MWKGVYQGRSVAVKALRVYLTSDFDKVRKVRSLLWYSGHWTDKLTIFVQRFCKEVMIWKMLRHPNVLPLLGVKMEDQQFVMVSEWMENGNINEFIKAHEDIDRIELVGFVPAVGYAPLSIIPFDSSKTSPGG